MPRLLVRRASRSLLRTSAAGGASPPTSCQSCTKTTASPTSFSSLSGLRVTPEPKRRRPGERTSAGGVRLVLPWPCAPAAPFALLPSVGPKGCGRWRPEFAVPFALARSRLNPCLSMAGLREDVNLYVPLSAPPPPPLDSQGGQQRPNNPCPIPPRHHSACACLFDSPVAYHGRLSCAAVVAGFFCLENIKAKGRCAAVLLHPPSLPPFHEAALLRWDPTRLFHTSAVCAAALDTATLPYRLNPAAAAGNPGQSGGSCLLSLLFSSTNERPPIPPLSIAWGALLPHGNACRFTPLSAIVPYCPYCCQ